MADEVRRELNCSLEVIFISVDIVDTKMCDLEDRNRMKEGWLAVGVKGRAKYICMSSAPP